MWIMEYLSGTFHRLLEYVYDKANCFVGGAPRLHVRQCAFQGSL